MSSGDANLAQDRVQSFLRDTTQQGDTFVPGKESNQSRAERVGRVIQAVDHQLANPSAAQDQGQSAHHSGNTADLNGVGQLFHGQTRH